MKCGVYISTHGNQHWTITIVGHGNGATSFAGSIWSDCESDSRLQLDFAATCKYYSTSKHPMAATMAKGGRGGAQDMNGPICHQAHIAYRPPGPIELLLQCLSCYTAHPASRRTLGQQTGLPQRRIATAAVGELPAIGDSFQFGKEPWKREDDGADDDVVGGSAEWIAMAVSGSTSSRSPTRPLVLANLCACATLDILWRGELFKGKFTWLSERDANGPLLHDYSLRLPACSGLAEKYGSHCLSVAGR